MGVYDFLQEEYPSVFGGRQSLMTPEFSYSPMSFSSTSQTQDPSNDHQYGDIFPVKEFTNPYDPSGLLTGMIRNSSSMLDGVNAQLKETRSSLNDLDLHAESDWGQVGAALVGGLASWAGGGSPSAIAGSAFKMGSDYYNNLEAHEKEKKARLDAQLKELETTRKDLTNFGQQLEVAQINNAANNASRFEAGQKVGSEPWAFANEAELAKEEASRRNTKENLPLSASQQAFDRETFPDLPPASSQKELDQRLRKRQQDMGPNMLDKRWEMQVNSQTPYGMERIDDGKAPLTSDQSARLTKIYGTYNVANKAISEGKQVIQRNQGMPVLGTDAKAIEGITSVLFDSMRGFKGTGANLTGPETELLNAINIPTLDRNGGIAVLYSYLTKGDFATQLGVVQSTLNKVIEAEARGLKHRIIPEREMKLREIQSDSGFQEFLKRKGLINE